MNKFVKLEYIYVLIGASIITYLLFGNTFIGMADNGDFLRILGTVGLNYLNPNDSYENLFFNYAHSVYAYDHFFRSFYPSSQIIIVAIMRCIAYLFNNNHFYVQFIGALYSMLLLVSGYLFIKYVKSISTYTAVVVSICILLVYHDIGYIAYFNSFYGEPVSFVFYLLTIGIGLNLLLKEQPSRALFTWFAAVSLFFICSKTQNAPMGIVLALFTLRYISIVLDGGSLKRLLITLSTSLLLFSAALYIFAPKEFKHINLYQTVFYGILKDSTEVEEDLRSLKLPLYLSILAGTNYFQKDTAIKQDDPILFTDFYNRITHKDVILFYIKHPSRMLINMSKAAEYAMNIRPYYLGNYERAAGMPSGAMTFKYSLWSEFKHKHIPNRLWFIAIVYLAYYAAAAYEWIKAGDIKLKMRIELLGLIGIIGFISFLVPLVGDGFADLSKHLFLFNVSFDTMLIVSVVYICSKLISKKLFML